MRAITPVYDRRDYIMPRTQEETKSKLHLASWGHRSGPVRSLSYYFKIAFMCFCGGVAVVKIVHLFF